MNLNNISKKINLTLLIIFVFSYSPQEPEAIAAMSMPKIGGRIVTYIPACVLPVPSINFSTVNPGVGTGLWSFIPGASFPYAYTPPAHPVQPILGLAGYAYNPCLIPCEKGACPIGPGGLNVLYSGTGV